MAETSTDRRVNILQLITVPALITLAVTILRLVGERQGWSKVWFNPEAGGGLAPIGIVWLVPVFGVYFAMKLAGTGNAPARPGRAALVVLLGLAVLVIGFVVAFAVSKPGMFGAQAAVCVGSIAAVIILHRAWPALVKTLLAYGFAARIPVTIIMYFAIRGDWHTHYDGGPPGFPADMNWLPKFILIGVLPQLFFWVTFTVIIGMLCGAIAVAVTNRGKQASAAAHA